MDDQQQWKKYTRELQISNFPAADHRQGAILKREARDHERTVQEENDVGGMLLRESSTPQSEKEFPCWLSALCVSMDRYVENCIGIEVLPHDSAQTRMCKSDLETPPS